MPDKFGGYTYTVQTYQRISRNTAGKYSRPYSKFCWLVRRAWVGELMASGLWFALWGPSWSLICVRMKDSAFEQFVFYRSFMDQGLPVAEKTDLFKELYIEATIRNPKKVGRSGYK